MSDLQQRIRDLEEQLARELAARQELEHALRESDARFRSMARNLTDMVLAYDMNRRLTFVNPAVHTLTGYSPADLEKEQFICWVHAEDRDRMLGYWDRLFEGHSFQRGRVPPGHPGRPHEVDGRLLGPPAGRERTPGGRAGAGA